MVQVKFAKFPLLLLISSDDKWTTVGEWQMQPQGMFRTYLNLDYRVKMDVSGEKDETLVSLQGSIEVHSSLFPHWTYLQQRKKRFVKLHFPVDHIQAVVDYHYGIREQLDLDTAIGVLEVAVKHDLDKVQTHAMRSLLLWIYLLKRPCLRGKRLTSTAIRWRGIA